ncbi:MAG: hypothetical protein AAGB93_07360 [Planctomycetota bacterium]
MSTALARVTLCLVALGAGLSEAAAQFQIPSLRRALPAGRWNTTWTRPNDAAYVDLPYTTLFVATQGREDNGQLQFPHLGTDVIASNNPAPMGDDGGLYAVVPGGRVVKVFPLPAHEAIPNLIDTPVGQLGKGAVVEPHISEDGTSVYFAWFHDQTYKRNGGGWLSQELSYKGSDLYRMDLDALIADPRVDPATLPIQRLTFKEYFGFHKSNTQQTTASRLEYAVNTTHSGHQSQNWGTCNMHMIEMRTSTGLKAVFVSDRARLSNSNSRADKPNHNFNLYIADILPDGSLGKAHQMQYYTTTSALSPESLRDGFTFSYQSSTDNFRRWDLQSVTSTGKWGPLLGYAQSSELYHFGTLITDHLPNGDLHDWFIGVKYYNLNNAGFGQLHLMDMDVAGINEFVYSPTSLGTTPEQITTLLTPGVTIRDLPSDQTTVNGEQVYIGKLSTPRAGRMGGEFLAAYTPTSAHRWVADADGEYGEFESRIAYRPNVEPFFAPEPYDPATGTGLGIVVEDAYRHYNLLWPTPVLSWMERHGTPRQSWSPPIEDPNTTIERGEPFAEVGTSAIWNTDLRPYECFFGTGSIPYAPISMNDNQEIAFDQSFDPLRYVQDQNDLCRYLEAPTVLGIQVNITSNQTDWDSNWAQSYETDATRLTWSQGQKEASRILGVYDVTLENTTDQSFVARIPADVPFDFHLLGRKYAMKLVDVRSWHSLQPRERRIDCGGCHQHEAGFGIPFAGTEASTRTPLDMTAETLFYTYDPACRPVLQSTPDATVGVPEWTQDVWPGFDQHCSSCHDSTQSSNNAALAALDYVDEESCYDAIRTRRYANSVQGALGSAVFWAAYGERTDGRDNDLAAYQPNYPAGNWGYRFSDVHATSPGLCAASNPIWAAWVHRLGQWIDNHMPRNTGQQALTYQLDRFHPTVDFSYSGNTSNPNEIRVGYWDDAPPLDLEIYHDDVLVATHAGLQNGSMLIDDGGLGGLSVIKVIAIDGAGNRQIKEKSILTLVREN